MGASLSCTLSVTASKVKRTLALTMGEIKADEPTLVRVQNNNVLRDALGLRKSGDSWSSLPFLARIAKEGKGVLVLFSPSVAGDIDEYLILCSARARTASRQQRQPRRVLEPSAQARKSCVSWAYKNAFIKL